MTIKEIAKLSGVGVSTVSRYLNNGYVSDEKKKVIAKVIEENNYRPSEAAMSLRGKSNEIVIIVQRVSSSTTSRFLEGVIAECNKHQLVPTIQVVNFDENIQAKYIKTALKRKVLGIIVYSFTENLSQKAENLLLVGQKSSEFKSIYSDGRKIYHTLVSNIIANNPIKKIVVLGIEIMDIEFINRVAGAVDAAKECNIECEVLTEQFDSVHQNFTIQEGTYYVGLTDAQAYQMLQAANQQNLRVGKDVFVTGYGDYHTSSMLGLTTIDGLYEEVGSKAVLNVWSNSKQSEEIIPKIVYRNSAY